MRTGSLATGIVVASTCAGPIFVLTFLVVALAIHPSQIVDLRLDHMATGIMALPIVTVFGMILSIVPNIAGAIGMAALADRFAPARCSILWVLVGGAMGILIAALVGTAPEGCLFLAPTSASCALICRKHISWTDEQEFRSPWARAY